MHSLCYPPTLNLTPILLHLCFCSLTSPTLLLFHLTIVIAASTLLTLSRCSFPLSNLPFVSHPLSLPHTPSRVLFLTPHTAYSVSLFILLLFLLSIPLFFILLNYFLLFSLSHRLSFRQHSVHPPSFLLLSIFISLPPSLPSSKPLFLNIHLFLPSSYFLSFSYSIHLSLHSSLFLLPSARGEARTHARTHRCLFL